MAASPSSVPLEDEIPDVFRDSSSTPTPSAPGQRVSTRGPALSAVAKGKSVRRGPITPPIPKLPTFKRYTASAPVPQAPFGLPRNPRDTRPLPKRARGSYAAAAGRPPSAPSVPPGASNVDVIMNLSRVFPHLSSSDIAKHTEQAQQRARTPPPVNQPPPRRKMKSTTKGLSREQAFLY